MDGTLLSNLCLLLLMITKGFCREPCSSASLIKNLEYRGTQCMTKRSFICDRGFFRKGWYYSKIGGSYITMPEFCPERASCGTLEPIWMNGKHPDINGSIVTREACVRGFMQNDCCANTITIEVKNCGAFFVYKLPETDYCDAAYCFGNGTCPALSQSTQAPAVLQPSDPCNTASIISKVKYRGGRCLSSEMKTPLCDRVLLTQWFKAEIFEIPLDMPQTCVPVASCGTLLPIWMNGSLPSFNDGIVKRNACVRGLRDSQCCSKTYEIKVRNCVTHNVYLLPYTDVCHESYCFGMQSCLVEKSATTPGTTTTNGTSNKLLYVIIGILVVLLVAAGVIIYLIVLKKKRSHLGSKVDIQSIPSHRCATPPPPYSTK